MKKMNKQLDRRNLLGAGLAFAALPGAALFATTVNGQGVKNESNSPEKNMQLYYLEIVSKDVEATCKVYAAAHGIEFGKADPGLGGARTAKMAGGGLLGVRAPMRASEEPVIRPYFLTDDIEAAVKKAAEAGAEIALPKMEIPGHGYCAVYLCDGNQLGLFQKKS